MLEKPTLVAHWLACAGRVKMTMMMIAQWRVTVMLDAP
jgi:hypothetical protein